MTWEEMTSVGTRRHVSSAGEAQGTQADPRRACLPAPPPVRRRSPGARQLSTAPPALRRRAHPPAGPAGGPTPSLPPRPAAAPLRRGAPPPSPAPPAPAPGPRRLCPPTPEPAARGRAGPNRPIHASHPHRSPGYRLTPAFS
jgi:hypothetical protein